MYFPIYWLIITSLNTTPSRFNFLIIEIKNLAQRLWMDSQQFYSKPTENETNQMSEVNG